MPNAKYNRAMVAQATNIHNASLANLAAGRGTQKDVQTLASVLKFLNQVIQEAIVLDSDAQQIVTGASQVITALQQQNAALQQQLQANNNAQLSPTTVADLTTLKSQVDAFNAGQQTGGTQPTTAPQGTTVAQPVTQNITPGAANVVQSNAGNVGGPVAGAQ